MQVAYKAFHSTFCDDSQIVACELRCKIGYGAEVHKTLSYHTIHLDLVDVVLEILDGVITHHVQSYVYI